MTVELAAQSTTSLRDRATAAWAIHQAKTAHEMATAASTARSQLTMLAHEIVQRALEVYDHSYPLKLFGDDQAFVYQFQRCTAEVVIEGERFEVRHNGDEWGLYHCWTCPDCGATEADITPTFANAIGELADLGYWLAFVAEHHRCEVA